jgi:hypothetical protein
MQQPKWNRCKGVSWKKFLAKNSNFRYALSPRCFGLRYRAGREAQRFCLSIELRKVAYPARNPHAMSSRPFYPADKRHRGVSRRFRYSYLISELINLNDSISEWKSRPFVADTIELRRKAVYVAWFPTAYPFQLSLISPPLPRLPRDQNH